MNKGVAVGLGAVAVVGAAYVGASVWAGQQVKRHYETQSDTLARQMPFLKAAQESHEGGVFSSTHTMTWRLGCLPQRQPDGSVKRGEPLQFTVVDRIQHGPLPGFRRLGAAAIDSELVLAETTRQALAEVFGEGKQPLAVRTLVGFDGRYVSTISSPAASIAATEKSPQLNWGGIQATVHGDTSGRSATYDFSLPGFEVIDARQGVTLKLTGFTMRGEAGGDGTSSLLLAGKSEGSLAGMEMSVRPPDGAASEPFRMSLGPLKFDGKATVDKELLSSTSSMTGSGQIGATRLDKIEMTASMKRLHVPSYLAMIGTLLDGSMSCEADKPEPDPQVVMEAMQKSLAALLPHNPEYSLDKLAVETGGKRGELSYAIAVAGVTEADLQLPAPMLLMTKGELKADVRLPVGWIEQLLMSLPGKAQAAAPQPEMVNVMLDQFSAQGLVVREGEFVSASLRFKNGQAEVNGKPLQLGRPPQQ